MEGALPCHTQAVHPRTLALSLCNLSLYTQQTRTGALLRGGSSALVCLAEGGGGGWRALRVRAGGLGVGGQGEPGRGLPSPIVLG